MHQAFILGAGLGTRLRPLTHHLPKPLVPLFHRPLAEWALESCAKTGIRRFAINTHHLPEAWNEFGSPFPQNHPALSGANGLPAACRIWNGNELLLFHEPDLLETGGGLKNIATWIGGEPLLIHNGDIFTTLPLEKLIAAHEVSGLPVTLALRSHGGDRRITLDNSGTRVIDVRGELKRGPGTHVFSGIYCVNPDFLELLPAGEKVSVIPAFLELAKRGELGAIVLDDGVWLDLGDRDSYLQAHRDLAIAPAIHPEAVIEPGAIVENAIVGPGAVIETGAIVRDSVVWPGRRVTSNADLTRCIICSGQPATGHHLNADL